MNTQVNKKTTVVDPYTQKQYEVKINRMVAYLNNNQGCNYDSCDVNSTTDGVLWAHGRKGSLIIKSFFDDGVEKEVFAKEKGHSLRISQGAEVEFF